MGSECHIEFGVRFVGYDGIRLGNRCHIARNTDVFANGSVQYPVDLGHDVRIREGCYIDAHGGWIRLYEKVFLGPQCVLYGHGGLSIGRNTMIAGQTTIIPANHIHSRIDIPLRDQGETARGIVIESDVWVGCRCVILDGVRIGHDAVIGAGAVVTRDVPPFAVAVGNPARIVRYRTSTSS